MPIMMLAGRANNVIIPNNINAISDELFANIGKEHTQSANNPSAILANVLYDVGAFWIYSLLEIFGIYSLSIALKAAFAFIAIVFLTGTGLGFATAAQNRSTSRLTLFLYVFRAIADAMMKSMAEANAISP